MHAPVTILTPAIEPRLARYLPEAIDSVRAQTVQPEAHYIGIDYSGRYNAVIQNELAAGVTTEWLVLLADDDLLHPTHLERCLDAASPDIDVVYTYADLHTWLADSIQRAVINQPWDPDRIRWTNWIPGGCALIRTSAWQRVGGCNTDPAHLHDHDWRMWQQIAATGGQFVCIPDELWTYRCHTHQLQADVDHRTYRPHTWPGHTPRWQCTTCQQWVNPTDPGWCHG